MGAGFTCSSQERKVVWKLVKTLNLAIAEHFERARPQPNRNSNKLNATSAAEVVGVAGQLLLSKRFRRCLGEHDRSAMMESY